MYKEVCKKKHGVFFRGNNHNNGGVLSSFSP